MTQLSRRAFTMSLPAATLAATSAGLVLPGRAAAGPSAKTATPLAQMTLGIVTLLLAVPLWAGLAHQVFAMAVLAMAVVHLRLTEPVATKKGGPKAAPIHLLKAA